MKKTMVVIFALLLTATAFSAPAFAQDKKETQRVTQDTKTQTETKSATTSKATTKSKSKKKKKKKSKKKSTKTAKTNSSATPTKPGSDTKKGLLEPVTSR